MAGRTLSAGQFRRVAQVALWSLTAIVVSGAAVRLTGSGLGCSSWPNCEPGELVPAADFHGWVEFGNRLITGVVSLAVIAAVSGAWLRRPRRRDLLWWAGALVFGVAAQVVLGAITVLTHLLPQVVMAHFAASMVLVVAATTLAQLAGDERNRDGERTDRQHRDPRRGLGATRHGVRGWCWVLAVITAVAVMTGTVVTASGPHGGDEEAIRLGFALNDVTRIHGVSVVCLVVASLGLLLLVGRRMRVAGADGSTVALGAVRRALVVCLVVMAAQATVGYVQYFNELPALLVGFHVAGATALVIAVTRLLLTAQGIGVGDSGRGADGGGAATDGGGAATDGAQFGERDESRRSTVDGSQPADPAGATSGTADRPVAAS